MARTLSAAMQTAISAKEGYADVWLIQITTSNTTLRYATAPSDVSWNSQTWTGIGGVIDFEPPPETSDPSGQSLRLTLSGVDTALIAQILNYELRGRDCTLYWGQITTSTGVVVADPVEAFGGLMNASWEISHTPSDESTRGTVTVSTTIVSEMARYLFRRLLRTNIPSLRLLQARSSRDIFDNSNPDVFFQTLPDLVGRPVYWGRVGAKANVAISYQGSFYGTEE
jgi:hypothetical protein